MNEADIATAFQRLGSAFFINMKRDFLPKAARALAGTAVDLPGGLVGVVVAGFDVYVHRMGS